MSRHKETLEYLFAGEEAVKIRKRGCSPASSSSSAVVQNSRTKRAIVAGKKVGGFSSTPLSTWRSIRERSPAIGVVRVAGIQTPMYNGKSGPEQPLTARKLAAMVWGMNEVRLRAGEDSTERARRRRDYLQSSLAPHLSDPCHSPVSERSGHQSQESLTSPWPKINDSSMMEIETRSRCQTTGSIVGSKTRLKDVSNALTTSKELLRIISRIWGHESRPSSTTSLMSALHTELERARLQVNQLIHEDSTDQTEMSYVLKRLDEEKATWKKRERETVQAAIKSISEELEVERKLRKRLEGLNKKLGGELTEMKASFLKVSEELEMEKRARDYVELVCDELVESIEVDKAKLEETKKESVRTHEEVENEREMMRIANALREEKAQIKLLDAKYHFEEKNAAIDKLIEAFQQKKQEKQPCKMDRRMDGNLVKLDFGFQRSEEQEETGEETDDEGFIDDDHLTIELSKDDFNKKINQTSRSPKHRNSKNHWVHEEFKRPRSNAIKASRRSTSLLRSSSDIVQWGNMSNDLHAFDKKLPQRKSCGDAISRYKSIKGLRGHLQSSSRPIDERGSFSPALQRSPSWLPQDPSSGTRSRLDGSLLESESGIRRSRWSVQGKLFG